MARPASARAARLPTRPLAPPAKRSGRCSTSGPLQAACFTATRGERTWRRGTSRCRSRTCAHAPASLRPACFASARPSPRSAAVTSRPRSSPLRPRGRTPGRASRRSWSRPWHRARARRARPRCSRALRRTWRASRERGALSRLCVGRSVWRRVAPAALRPSRPCAESARCCSPPRRTPSATTSGCDARGRRGCGSSPARADDRAAEAARGGERGRC